MTDVSIVGQQADEFVPPPGAERIESEDAFTPPAGAVKIENDEFVPPEGAKLVSSQKEFRPFPKLVDMPAAAALPVLAGMPVAYDLAQSTQEYIMELDKRRESRDLDIADIVGDINYDKEDTFVGGMEGYFRQIDIARSGDITDKQTKFRDTFPNGSLIEIQTSDGPVLLARENSKDKWKQLSFSPKALASIVAEPTVGSMVGTFAKGPWGAALTGVGAGVGVLAQQFTEGERGFGAGEGGFGRIAEESAITAAFDAALRGLGRFMFGPKLPQSFVEAGEKAIKAAEREGLSPIVKGQVGGPFKRGLFRQAGAITDIVETKITQQEESLLKAFAKRSETEVMTDKVVMEVLDAQQRELASILNPQGLLRADAAKVLQDGIEIYKKASKLKIDDLYRKALFLSDDVVFSVRGAQRLASEIDTGVLGRGKVVDVPSAVVDATGKPAFTTQKTIPVKLSETPEGKLRGVVDDILALNPKIEKYAVKGRGTWESFEQIKTLRTRLFDLKQSDDAGVSREAGRLWTELTKSMDNPISGDPQFVSAYRTASAANRVRESNLELSYIGRILKSDTMDDLARRYFSPGHSTELAKIKELLPEENFLVLKDAFIGDIVSRKTASEGLTTFKNFATIDKAGLNTMLNPADQLKVRKFLDAKVKFESSPVAKIAEKELTEGERIFELIKGTSGEISKMVKQTGGLEGDFARLSRAAIFKRILEDSSKTTPRGVEVIDAKRLMSHIDTWKKNEKLKQVFRNEDWTLLEGVEKYASLLAGSTDAGGAMVAGAVRQAAIEAPTATLWGRTEQILEKLFRPLMNNTTMAWFLTRPTRKMYKGTPNTYVAMVQVADTLGVIQREYERDGGSLSKDASIAASKTFTE